MDSRDTQRGFAAAMRRTRALSSASTGGRPRESRAERLVQCSRNRRRCQRRTVSGATMTNACFQPLHSLDSATQKSRSPRRSLGRATVLLYTVSCWRRARFSRASWRWPPQRNGRSRSRWSRRMIIGLGLCPDHGRQINHLPVGRDFGEGQGSRDFREREWGFMSPSLLTPIHNLLP